jgi:hypothetical protein
MIPSQRRDVSRLVLPGKTKTNTKMNTPILTKLAPHSRVWIYQANRFLTEAEQLSIEKAMQEFVPKWASHGNELYGDFALSDSLFLVVGADEQKSPTSGCSIDSLNRHIQQIGQQLNVDFFNRLQIAYVDAGGQLKLLPMSDFKVMIKNNVVTADTPVFNNLVLNKAELDSGWRTTIGSSWHKNLLDLV